MTRNQSRRALLGAAVAGILGGIALQARADEPIPAAKLKKMKVVACYGINSCAQHGSCSGAHNGCAAQNSCRGQGWLPVPKESCLAIPGGSLTPLKKA